MELKENMDKLLLDGYIVITNPDQLNLRSFIISCLNSNCQVEPIQSILTLD